MVKPYSDNPSIFATGKAVIATYTVDYRYVSSYELTNGDERKYLAVGTVVAQDPTTLKIIPNFTNYVTYPTVLGVLADDADCGVDGKPSDDIVGVVVRGILYINYCYDNGTYGTVLSSTKDCLTSRVWFVADDDTWYTEHPNEPTETGSGGHFGP